MVYDLNGNITNLKRSQGVLAGSPTAMTIDDLSYDYTGYGNALKTVTDLSGQYNGYPDTSGNTIGYDLNGNMKNQVDKGILNIDYNFLNLPKAIKFNEWYIIRNPTTGTDEERNIRAAYIYRADGTKLRKSYTTYFSKGSAERTVITDYLDGFQYTVNHIGTVSLEFVPTSEGYFNFKNNKYIYNYADHLGNIRLSYFNNGSSTEVLEENNYYPFGLKHDDYNVISGNPSYTYKYNGKELQMETGMYDYGARFYMPDIGRWGVVDPLAEKYTRMSPYTYVGNNPARFVDYDGRDYGMYIDFKTGTVTIKATYYATANDMKSANQATKMWNDISGKYNYTYKDANGNKVSMKVKFELQTSEVAVSKGEKRLDVLNKAMESATKGEGNIYRVSAGKDMEFGDNGTTAGGNSIRVKDSRADTETGAHEVGHTLGADHTSSGILTTSSEDINRSNDINSSNISDIMNAIVGTPLEPNKAKDTTGGLGKATIHIQNNNLQTDKDYKKFKNGSIQSAE
jgi:RHS repeat-associated protein